MAFQPLQGLLDLGGGVAAHAHEHRHAARHRRHGTLDELVDLALVEGRRFARGAEREQPVDAQRQIVLDQPLVALEVDGAILERRHDGQPEACNHLSLHRPDGINIRLITKTNVLDIIVHEPLCAETSTSP
jgi:hypothetical protein